MKESKQYRRIGAKSKVILIRVSEVMQQDLEQMSDTMQMTISDFVRIAVRNAITYYSKKSNAIAVNNAEIEEYQRAYQHAMKKESEVIAPTDEDMQKLLKARAEKLANK
jgi:antitoxin component of RelBE/YafQ-DinJ toxin-antitoxin module